LRNIGKEESGAHRSEAGETDEDDRIGVSSSKISPTVLKK
jgi:hypothetical protein